MSPSPTIDLLIYAVHALYWGSFAGTVLVLRSLDRRSVRVESSVPMAKEQKSAPFSRVLLGFHMAAFALMYFGMANAVVPGRVPTWFVGQRWAGTVIILCGAGLLMWARLYFRSWRFRAELNVGHELATGGPFRFFRHPIYLGLNLLALGSAIWIPTALVWAAFGLMMIGSDLRARAEETLLTETFGASYRDYCGRTRRFIPGIY
jgi:protein-S-isoprenylcysteine O-methyltransferase Ste14